MGGMARGASHSQRNFRELIFGFWQALMLIVWLSR